MPLSKLVARRGHALINAARFGHGRRRVGSLAAAIGIGATFRTAYHLRPRGFRLPATSRRDILKHDTRGSREYHR